MEQTARLGSWARETIDTLRGGVDEAYEAFCQKPRSAKRVHALRKALARLKAALEDVAELLPDAPALYEETKRLHKRAGKVRDADVMLAKLAALGTKEVNPLCKTLRQRRETGRSKLEKSLSRTNL
jgi:CHAD domain-containing protein